MTSSQFKSLTTSFVSHQFCCLPVLFTTKTSGINANDGAVFLAISMKSGLWLNEPTLPSRYPRMSMFPVDTCQAIGYNSCFSNPYTSPCPSTIKPPLSIHTQLYDDCFVSMLQCNRYTGLCVVLAFQGSQLRWTAALTHQDPKPILVQAQEVTAHLAWHIIRRHGYMHCNSAFESNVVISTSTIRTMCSCCSPGKQSYNDFLMLSVQQTI